MSNQLSARARGRPSTGNSNIINLERQQVSQPAYHSARAHTSSLRASYPPPTIAVPDEIPRSRLRPLTCPQEWIENNSKTDLFDKSGFNVEVADSERKYFAKQFVERNQDSLWKYNTEYIGKTPRTVYKEIAGDYYLHSKITQLYYKEKLLNNQSSDRLRNSLKDDHLAENRAHPFVSDPFAATTSTSRREFRSRRAEALQSGTAAMVTEDQFVKHRRGYKHEPEYGNFTLLTGILQKNEGTMIKR